MELNENPINREKVMKMKPRIKIDRETNTFIVTFYIPGFKNEDITVYSGNGKISVKAVDKTKSKNIKICKVYKADYLLPKGAVTGKLRKSYQDDILCIRGEIKT